MRLLPLVLLASATALPAQTPASVNPSAAAQGALRAQMSRAEAVVTGPQICGCPVAFTAQRFAGGGLVQTRKGLGTHDLEYHLSFNASLSHPQAITQARVTLHGLDSAKMLPASSSLGSATEEFSLSPRADQGGRFQSVLYARKLTGVQSIELNELTYADGTRWHESAGNPCRIAPNGYMLVASGR